MKRRLFIGSIAAAATLLCSACSDEATAPATDTSLNADASAGADSTQGDSDAVVEADTSVGPKCDDQSQLALYEKRIKPLVDGSQPSSCNQCHLAGVDLSMYVRATPCETMACLVAQGMVDFDAPKDSKILEQIKMAKPSSDLITAEVIAAEHDGFLEWIEFSASCMGQVCGDTKSECTSTPSPDQPSGATARVLGGCTEPELAALFQEKVWKWRGRCAPCHVAPGTSKFDVAHFFDGAFQQGDGPEKEAKSALYSMYNVIGIKAVNLEEPDQSLLLLNPLAPSAGGLPHAGHVKIANKEEKTYKDFLLWIETYAECNKKAPQTP